MIGHASAVIADKVNSVSRLLPLPLIVISLIAAAPGFLPAQADSSGCSSELCNLVASGRLEDLRWPDFSDYRTRLQGLYEPSGYALAWIDHGDPTPAAKSMIEILQDANAKGLNSEDYDGSLWPGRLVALGLTGEPKSEVAPFDPARFDLALSVCVMRYASDLHFGKINPGLLHNAFDLDREKPDHEENDMASFVRDRLTGAANAKAVLDGIEPPFEGYRRTLVVLQKYLALAKDWNPEPLPPTAKPVDPGKAYPAAAQLANILLHFGDLPADALLPSDANLYAGMLVDAVKRFQARHGLDADGRIGKATLDELNTPIDHRIRQLQLTLERWRWAPHDFSVPPIVVNIPEFQLRALDRDFHTELGMKVVVGKAYHHQTPVFASEMTSVGFRPYWDVPLSIQRAELVPKIAHDRSYLAENNFEVVNAKREVVSTGDVDDALLARLRALQLYIRQVPGPKNSLGLIKFVFPNQYDVYMHDTPVTELFAQTRRDFSHGCIRLEKPEQLAAWVLRDKPEWTPERINDAAHGEKTFEVRLSRPIPVLIVYATAVALANGEVRFLEDIYGLDAQLEQLLAKGYPYSPSQHSPSQHSPSQHSPE
jgi:murein L,D-transpeptidase YcbB/YkuD